MRASRLFAVALSLALPLSARADVLIHDGGAARDADATTAVTAATGAVPTLVLSAELFAGPTHRLIGNATLQPCTSGAIPIDVRARTDEIVEAVLSYRLEDALASIEALGRELPCSDAPVPADALALIAFLRGAARLDLGDEAGARAAMFDSLAIAEDFEGPRGFPQNHMDLLESARNAAPPGSAPFFLFGEDGAEVRVDGKPVADPRGGGVALRPGRHLVQVRIEAEWGGTWVETSGKPAVIVEAAAGRAVWADGATTAGGELALRAMLGEEFGGNDGAIHILRWGGRKGGSGLTVPTDGAAITHWGSTAPPAVADKPRPPREEAAVPNRAGRIRFALGGGYGFVAPFSYVTGAFDVSVRLAGPVGVVGFVRPSYGGNHRVTVSGEAATGAILLVPFGAGLGVQRQEDVAPFARVVFQGAPNQVEGASTFLGGAAFQGGLDLSPANSPFLFRLQGELGFLGRHLAARAWAGAGARF